MKTKFLLLCCIFIFCIDVKAQEPQISYHKKMEMLTKELDSTRFRNNILYDRAYPLAKLNEFNQNQRVDTSNVSHFKQAVHEIHVAANRKSIAFVAEDLQQIIYGFRIQKKVGIGIINCDFTMLKTTVLDETNPLLEVDGIAAERRYHEIVNKNPYENKQSLVIAMLQERIEQGASPIIFSIQGTMFQETTNPIKDLSIKFDNGQTTQLIANGIKTVTEFTHTFERSGVKNIEYIGEFLNKMPIKTLSTITIDFAPQIAVNKSPNKCETEIIHLRTDEVFTPYQNEPLNIQHNATNINIDERAALEYKIFYSGTECVLRKPILIMDGIDYGDERTIEKIYFEVLKQSDNPDPNANLGAKLRELGYDVVIANFPVYKIATYRGIINSHEPEILDKSIYRDGGADYIQRNAKAIKKLIKTLNTSLITNNSAEKLVVVGPSMGGLVSRWALKELENEGYDHNTKLWVSFDSPHQGANIPLSMQYAAEFAENFDQLYKLNRPASKQILVHHYTNGNTCFGGAPAFRDRFNSELSTMCYPVNNIKKIALVNGASNGFRNNVPEGLLATTKIWMTSFPYADAASGYLQFSGDSGTNLVFKLKKRSGLTYETITKYAFSSPVVGSYDVAPGCKFSLLDEATIGGYFNPASQPVWCFDINLYGNVLQYANSFTFMPTKSTLDFKGINPLLQEPLNNRNLVTTRETPFDAYYTPPTHEEHVELNTANVAWLLNQLNTTTNTNSAQNVICGLRVDAISINGSNNLCDVIQKTYTLEPNNLNNVVWSVSNLEIIWSNNQQIRVRKINPSQTSSISASYTGGGTSVQASKMLMCNRPNMRFAINYSNTSNPRITLSDVPNEFPICEQQITTVDWTITSGDGQIGRNGSIETEVYGNSFTGIVTTANEAGETYSQNFFWPDPENCKGILKTGLDQYQIVDRCSNNALISSVSAKEVYNVYGYKIEDLPLSTSNLNLQTGNSGDIQILHVVSEGEHLTKRIIKD